MGYQRLRVAYVNKERAAQQEENQLLLQLELDNEQAIVDKVRLSKDPSSFPSDNFLIEHSVPAHQELVLFCHLGMKV